MKILQYKKTKSSGQRGRPAQNRGMQATGSEQRDTGRFRTEGTGHRLRREGCKPLAQDRGVEADSGQRDAGHRLRAEGCRLTQDRGAQPGSGQRDAGHQLRTEAQRPSSWLTPLLCVRVPQLFSLFVVFPGFLYLSYV